MQKFICVCFLTALAHATHFRGGIFSWKPVNNTAIDIFIRMSWRRSFTENDGDLECDSEDIRTQSKVQWGTSLRCRSGCFGTLVRFPGVLSCTDFSESEDWSTLAGNYIYSIGLNARFTAWFKGGDWLNTLVVGRNSDWNVLVSIDTRARSDNGKINTSPVTAMLPLVKLRHGCDNNIINITVDDADGDVVRCRWSIGIQGECGGVCSAFPGAILDQAACSLSVPSSVTAGLYAVAVMIEDFAPADANFNTPLSKIPLQFLVNVTKSNIPCNVTAVFSSFTRIAGSCIGIPPNTTFTEPVNSQLLINGVPRNQTDLRTVSPIGLVTSTPRLVIGSTDEWSVTVTWTPTPAQIGPHVFCFQGEFGPVSTEQRCATFLVGDSDPKPITVSPYDPTGKVSVDQQTWTIKYDKPIVKQQDTRYIYFHEVGVSAYVVRVDASSSAVSLPNGSNVPYSLKIVTSFTFTASTSYYILLDPGVVKGSTGCGTESSRLSNKTAWIFFTASKETCDLNTYPGDVTKFWQNVSPGIRVERDCAPGTAFVKSTCECSGKAAVVQSDCEHDLYVPFDSNHRDYKQRVHVKRGRGMNARQRDMPGYVGTGAAFFSGTINSYLLISRWNNAYFGTEFMIKFRFAEDQSVTPSAVLESLVTNGHCGVQPSVGLMLDRTNSSVTAVIVTDRSGTKGISGSYSGTGWKDIEYVYNGSVLSLNVSGQISTVIVRGKIEPRPWALQVGAGCGLRHYKGHMDELYVYDYCLPN